MLSCSKGAHCTPACFVKEHKVSISYVFLIPVRFHHNGVPQSVQVDETGILFEGFHWEIPTTLATSDGRLHGVRRQGWIARVRRR